MTHHTPSNGPGLLDLHLHSTCSVDGASSIAEYARRAVELGLAELGFCEHVDLDPRDRGCNYLDPVHYAREIVAAREEMAARAQLADPMMPPSVRLRQGVEVTYQASRADEANAWLAGGDWDYVVISVHLVDYADGWAIVSEPEAMGAYFAAHSQRQAYAPYFEERFDPGRPWRILHINRSIAATRTHNRELMRKVFDELVETLPEDAMQFFKQAIHEVDRRNYPAAVRELFQEYFDRQARAHMN